MQKFFLFVCVCVLSALVAQKARKVQPVLDNVLLKNVEALAIGESSQSIYCPYPGKGCIIKYTNGTYETIPNHWANPR